MAVKAWPPHSYDKVKPGKVVRKPIKPFTLDEILTIISGFQEKTPHYVPFVKFLFWLLDYLEAIGFRWGHVDFGSEWANHLRVLSKDILGNGYTRVRKETKTGSIRTWAWPPRLGLLLEIKPDNPASDRLVFKTKEGCKIHWRW